MDYFDKKINELFDGVGETAPSGYSWQDMESGIKSKMGKTSKRYLYFAILGIAAGFLFIFFTTITSNNSTNQYPIKHKNYVETQSDKNNIHRIFEKKTAIANFQNNEIKLNKKHPYKYQIANDKKYCPNCKTIHNNNQTRTKKNTLTIKSSITVSNSFNHNSITKIKLANPIIISVKNSKTNIHLPFKTPIKINKIHSNNPIFNRYFLVLTTGSNIMMSSKHSENRFADNYTKQLPSFFTDFSIKKSFKNNWIASLGYNYNHFIELFKFKKIDQVKKEFKNVVILKNTNSLNGRTAEIFGDTVIFRKRYRNITNYNKNKIHSLYFGIAKTIAINNKFNLALGGRFTYSFLLKNKGISIDKNEELIYFNKKSNGIVTHNKFSIGINANIEYQLNDKWKIGSSINIDKYINTIGIDSEEKYTPISNKIGIMLSYKL